MWNGKYITTDSIIEDIFRDSEYRNEVMLDDVISWVGQAIELIGVQTHLVEKITDGNDSLAHPDPVVVSQFRARLPNDLHRVEAVADMHGNRYMQAQGNLHMSTSEGGVNPKYKLMNNMLFTNRESDILYITYKSLPVSATGFPLIPDDEKYRQAVQWFVIERMDYKLWRKGLIADKVYQKSEQERAWYIGAAQSSMIAPDEDEMEVIQNTRMRLIPQLNDWGNFFENTGVVEQRYIGPYSAAGITVTGAQSIGNIDEFEDLLE